MKAEGRLGTEFAPAIVVRRYAALVPWVIATAACSQAPDDAVMSSGQTSNDLTQLQGLMSSANPCFSTARFEELGQKTYRMRGRFTYNVDGVIAKQSYIGGWYSREFKLGDVQARTGAAPLLSFNGDVNGVVHISSLETSSPEGAGCDLLRALANYRECMDINEGHARVTGQKGLVVSYQDIDTPCGPDDARTLQSGEFERLRKTDIVNATVTDTARAIARELAASSQAGDQAFAALYEKLVTATTALGRSGPALLFDEDRSIVLFPLSREALDSALQNECARSVP